MDKGTDRLIVALDTKESLRHIIALHQAGVTFFKLNATTMLDSALFSVLHLLDKLDADLFLDLKIYDTRDTVYNIARRVFDLGARFLTVHAAPSMLEAAMSAKPKGGYAKVIAVGPLTDGLIEMTEDNSIPAVYQADGLVCQVSLVQSLRDHLPAIKREKILVCPGIRSTNDIRDWDNHTVAYTVQKAILAGANHLVIGRPITKSQDPAAAARAIIAEIEEVA